MQQLPAGTGLGLTATESKKSVSNKRPYLTADFFVLRTPLLPFDLFDEWGRDLTASVASTTGVTRALENDRRKLRKALQSVFDRPEVREALFVASPDLEATYAEWARHPDGPKGRKIERALVRYFSRMCWRCTPFGLCAGCSVGSVGNVARLDLAPTAAYRRHVRFDCEYLSSLLTELRATSLVWKEVRYWPNSTAREVGSRLLYTVSVTRHDAPTLFRDESAAYDRPLAFVLRLARGGIIGLDLISQLVADFRDVALCDAEAYVKTLIDAQILQSELAICVTGPEPGLGLATILQRTIAGSRVGSAMATAQQEVLSLRRIPLGAGPEQYRQALTPLTDAIQVPPSRHTFQVDLLKPVRQATLDQALINDILDGAEALRCLTTFSDPLRDFKTRFLERFGAAEVPLLLATNEDEGLWRADASPYVSADDSPLIDAIRFPSGSRISSTPWGPRELLLLDLLLTHQRDAGWGVSVDLETLAPLATRIPPLPNAFSVKASLLCLTVNNDDAEPSALVEWVSGPSGAPMLGRFCHSDPELHSHVLRHLQAEEALSDDGAVVAEVVHQPGARIANVLLRPVLRRYEIDYLGRSGAEQGSQIAASDLLLSVVDDRVLLRSQRLQRTVIPSITTAMGIWTAPPVYAFLTYVATQGVCATAGFSWQPFDRVEHLPRVTCGRAILSLEQWTLSEKCLTRLSGKHEERLYSAVSALRRELSLPRYVQMVDGDAALLIDLDNILSIESFAQHVQHRTSVRLTEALVPSKSCAVGPEGRFTNEIVVPFVGRSSPRAPSIRTRRHPPRIADRETYIPGDTWLFAKLYAPHRSIDRFIVDIGSSLIANLRDRQLLERWFFVRYGDPDWHLRLRIKGATPDIWSVGLPILRDLVRPLRVRRAFHRLEYASYEPEIARYGGSDGMALAERIFEVDSTMTLEVIESALAAESADPDWRWQVALWQADRLLRAFSLSLDERYRFVTTAYAISVTAATGVSPSETPSMMSSQLGAQFRRLRPVIDRLLADGPAPIAIAGVPEILQRRSQQIDALACEARQLDENGRLDVPMSDWLGSILHMSMNRLIPTNARQHEVVIMALLRRLYESLMARRRSAPATDTHH